MRRLIGCVLVALVAVGSGGAAAPPVPQPDEPTFQVHQTPSPFTEVTAGSIRAMVPHEWHPVPLGGSRAMEEGFVAAPRPNAWGRPGGPAVGMAAVWVDGTHVGVPSDYYYLAATSPVLGSLTASSRCEATRVSVYANHRPTFAGGVRGSSGDYVARGQGVCTIGKRPTRWAYFVAAPGYGPVRRVGIPASCLYFVIAVLPDSPRASSLLNKLLLGTEFGTSSVSRLIAVAQAR